MKTKIKARSKLTPAQHRVKAAKAVLSIIDAKELMLAFSYQHRDAINAAYFGKGAKGSVGTRFAAKFGKATSRSMRAICRNLIRNRGTFKPEQDVKQLA